MADHVYHGRRQYLEPLAHYLGGVMSKIMSRVGDRATKDQIADAFIDFAIMNGLEMLIQHGVRPTRDAVVRATPGPAAIVRERVDALIAEGVVEAQSVSGEVEIVRSGRIDEYFGSRSEDPTMKLFSRYWGEDVEDLLRTRFRQCTGRADDQFSVANLSPAVAKRLGLDA